MIILMNFFVGFLISTHICYVSCLAGFDPTSYCPVEKQSDICPSKIDVYVNRLTSEKSLVSYEYHSADLCVLPNEREYKESPIENLGQVLLGERIRPSMYNVTFKKDVDCQLACAVKVYKSGDVDSIRKLSFLEMGIHLNYQHHWIIDNMPVTWCYQTTDSKEFCHPGFPVGCYVTKDGVPKDACVGLGKTFDKKEQFVLFNHVDILLEYHGKASDWGVSVPEEAGRLVRAKITPRSIDNGHLTGSLTGDLMCELDSPLILNTDSRDVKIAYTYSVKFRENKDLRWSSRWDYILESMTHSSIQWFSIICSVTVALFLAGLLTCILSDKRELQKDSLTSCSALFFVIREDVLAVFMHKPCDITKEEEALTCENKSVDEQQEFGWRSVQGDVFRTPCCSMLLSAFVGSGVQVLCTALVIMSLTSIGLLTQNGALLTCAIYLYVCLGILAGFVSAKVFKLCGGERWLCHMAITSLLCPGIVFVLFVILDLIILGHQSSVSVPFSTLITLLALWLFVDVPLTCLGIFLGFRFQASEITDHINSTPGNIPEQSLGNHPLVGAMFGGLLPFGCLFFPLFFIFNAIWRNYSYFHMYGILLLSFLLMIVTISLVAVLLCYKHLCAEDYRWWWRSFLTGGSTAFYFFAYSVFYYVTMLEIEGFASAFLYFGYTLMMTFIFFLLSGSVGFGACCLLVNKLYGVAK